MRIRFAKVDASGNDFLVVNTADGSDRDWSAVARTLCRRRRGVGADGLAVIEHLGRGRFTVRCTNADGTPSPTDGNAMRACARAIHSRYGYREAWLRSGGREYAATVDGCEAAVVLDVDGPLRGPILLQGPIPLRAPGPRAPVYAVRVGAEQAVAVLAGTHELDGLDVTAAGARIRRAPVFGPSGANVGFAAVLGPDQLALRCYERGPEHETPSSGSGAAAAVLVLRTLGRLRYDDVTVETTGGDPLRATVLDDRRVRVAGAAVEIFDGEAAWDDARGTLAGSARPRIEARRSMVASASR